ncbi:MAG: hypothetical protein V4735_01730 [Pseudomonadota bacterium]
MKTILLLSTLAMLSACELPGSPMANDECGSYRGLTVGTIEYNECVMRIDQNTTATRK